MARTLGIAKVNRMTPQRRHHMRPYNTSSFSNLELSNRKFKIVAWSSGALLVGVLTALIFELLGFLK